MLFLSPLLAMPAQHGGCVYPHAVLNALHAAGIPIDYVWLAWPLRGRRAVMRDPLRAGYIGRGYVPGTCRVGSWRLRTPAEWWSRPPAPPTRGGAGEAMPGPDEQSYFRQIVKQLKPRTVLIDFTTTLPVLDSLTADERASIRVAVLTHNLIHRRTELYREARNTPSQVSPWVSRQHSEAPEFQPATFRRNRNEGAIPRFGIQMSHPVISAFPHS